MLLVEAIEQHNFACARCIIIFILYTISPGPTLYLRNTVDLRVIEIAK